MGVCCVIRGRACCRRCRGPQASAAGASMSASQEWLDAHPNRYRGGAGVSRKMKLQPVFWVGMSVEQWELTWKLLCPPSEK